MTKPLSLTHSPSPHGTAPATESSAQGTGPPRPSGDREKERALSLSQKILKRHAIPWPSGPRHTIFLASSARSGSTWIMETINARNDFRLIFEPFWAERMPLCRHFLPRQYLRVDVDDPKHVVPARTIITGRFRNKWADAHTKRIFCRRRLIKDIRTNLILGWLARQFPEMRLILLLRHPCAVAHSKIQVQWRIDPNRRGAGQIEHFLAQPTLVDDFLDPYVSLMRSTTDTFQRFIIGWCVETLVPLKQLTATQVHVIFYERVRLAPEREMRELFNFLGMSYDPTILAHVDRPSRTARKDSLIRQGPGDLDPWRSEITRDQLCRALDILSTFGLQKIYNEASEPDPEAAHQFLATAE